MIGFTHDPTSKPLGWRPLTWEQMCQAEPALCEAAFVGLDNDPEWYAKGGGKDLVVKVVGWGRGPDWTREEECAIMGCTHTRTGIFSHTAAQFMEVPEHPGAVALRKADRARGAEFLWSREAYDIAYHHCCLYLQKPTVKPTAPAAVYRIYDAAGRLLYIGSGKSSLVRLSNHLAKKPWAQQIASMQIQHLPSRAAAYKAEAQAIRQEHPLYNVVGNRQAQPPEGCIYPTGSCTSTTTACLAEAEGHSRCLF